MDIFIDNLNEEMSYALKMQCPPIFNKMVENGIKIEEALVKKGVLKLQREGNNSSNNTHHNSDKIKFWNRNRNIVNDGIIDANTVKPKQPIFNLSSHTSTTNHDNNKPRLPFSNFCKKFTPIGEPFELALKTLPANKLITLPEVRDFEPKVKPASWNDNHFCKYHRNKGHQTNDCQRLKNVIQYLIDNEVIMVDEHITNESYTTFKTLLPNYEKDETSTSRDRKGKEKANYAHTYDNVVNVILVKEKSQPEPAHAITCSKGKVTLPRPTTNAPSTSRKYNIVDQL